MKIKNIIKHNMCNVYDISVNHSNSRFFANNMSVHNCRIVHKYIYSIVSQNTMGIPIDYDHAMKSLRTTIRRIILLERKWNIIQETHKKDYKISSNEQANIFVGDLLRKHFFGSSDSFDQWAMETFMMKTKHITVGKDDKARLKTTYGMDDSVMSLILAKLPTLNYPNDIKDAIFDTLDILALYRSLTHDLPYYVGLIRSAWRDDKGIVMGSGATRMEGTDCLVANTPVNIRVDGNEVETTMDKLGELCSKYKGCEGIYNFDFFVELQCGQDEWVEVTHFVTKVKETINIITDRVEIGCALNHRFMSDTNQWVTASSLKIGNKLKSLTGYDTVIGINNRGTEMTYDVVTNHGI